MQHALQELVHAASLAPSGDNTQPWHFEVDEATDRLILALDSSRDPSPMNAGQRMARIACGAALENMERTLHRNRWKAEVSVDSGGYSATLQLFRADESRAGIEPAIFNRCSNRKLYRNEPVPQGVKFALNSMAAAHTGPQIHWIWEPTALRAFGELEAAAFKTMYSKRRIRAAILDNVRFDRQRTEKVKAGLSLGSLELNPVEAFLFKRTGKLPDWFVKSSGILWGMGQHVKRLVGSSSGLCLITVDEASPRNDWEVGRAVQKAWLSLTEQGLSAQPMMSLPVLEQISRHSVIDTHGLPDAGDIANLVKRWPEVLPGLRNKQVLFVLRVGYADQPTARTGRRRIQLIRTQSNQPYEVKF